MYRVAFYKSALKDLDRIPTASLVFIQEAINKLKNNPRPRGCKKIKGLSGLFRIRVGIYRIIYTIEDKQLLILIINVRHRKNIYR